MHPSLLPRRIASVMTDSKKTPCVPIENRPLLGVDEVEALTGVPAKIIRANVRNGLLKACMAGSTTMRSTPRAFAISDWSGGIAVLLAARAATSFA